MNTFLFTLLALLAFAGNSVLCRLALAGGHIDAENFTIIRLLSGALTLILLLLLSIFRQSDGIQSTSGNTKGALALFGYALFFSVAYLQLDTATGALVLFGTVQLSLIAFSLFSGKRISALEICGVFLAVVGLLVLLLPGAEAPSVFGLVLMLISGICWAGYTLMGRVSKLPLADTTKNFVYTLPLCALSFVFSPSFTEISDTGILLAIASGCLTSAIGYAIWYRVLPSLSILQSGVIQLLVPLLAAAGGIIFVGEAITIQFLISAVLILSGILLVQWHKASKAGN